MNRYSPILTVFFITLLLFVSCKKDTNDTLISGATDYTVAEALFTDIFRITDAAMKTEPGVYRIGPLNALAVCSNNSLSPALPDTTFPKILTIDYGLVNCTGADGRKRRGKIVANINNKYRNAGTSATLSLVNFAINDHKITGSVVITYNGPSYTLNVQNGRITTPEGEAISFQSVTTREWSVGSATQDPNDDIYLITGSSNGTGRQGVNFTTAIKTGLRSEPFCRSITTGTLEIVINSKNNATIDYGTGACDDDATMVFDKRTFFLRLQ